MAAASTSTLTLAAGLAQCLMQVFSNTGSLHSEPGWLGPPRAPGDSLSMPCLLKSSPKPGMNTSAVTVPCFSACYSLKLELRRMPCGPAQFGRVLRASRFQNSLTRDPKMCPRTETRISATPRCSPRSSALWKVVWPPSMPHCLSFETLRTQ